MFLVIIEIWNNRYQGCYSLFILISLLSSKTSCESVVRFLRYQVNRLVTVLALVFLVLFHSQCFGLNFTVLFVVKQYGSGLRFVSLCFMLLGVDESCHLHSAWV